MQTGPLQPVHRPAPAAWAACRAEPFGASEAPPGTVVFHRFLHDLNRTRPDPPAPLPLFRQPRPCDTFERTTPPAQPTTGPGLLPRLGEILPTTPAIAPNPSAWTKPTPAPSGLIDVLA